MRKELIFFFIVAITFLSSCTTYRYVYTASPPNNPYFTQKGESKATAYYSAAGSNDNASGHTASGWDLQGAYAIGNHCALTTSYLNRTEIDNYNFGRPENSSISYTRNLFDIGAGYFLGLDKEKHFSFNLYGGMAFGKFSFVDERASSSRFHNSSITKSYFQPSVNFMPTPNFRMSLVTKFSFVHYGNIKTSYTPDEIQNLSLNLIAERTVSFFEPAFNIQFGIRQLPWVKLDYTFSGTSQPFKGRFSQLESRSSNVSIGLSFDFSKM
jgi:hypothetical protein